MFIIAINVDIRQYNYRIRIIKEKFIVVNMQKIKLNGVKLKKFIIKFKQ